MSGHQRAGSKLVQQQLAKQFGVAQGVVREALLELQACGLVEAIDNKGVFVAELNAQKLLESFEIREVHEGLAARLCCDRMTRAQIRDLVELAEQIHRLAIKKHDKEMGELDRELHQRIVRASGNTMLVRLAENYRVLGKVVRTNRDAEKVRIEHLEILEAIEAGRADDAERLMRAHIQLARKAVEDAIGGGAFVPHWV